MSYVGFNLAKVPYGSIILFSRDVMFLVDVSYQLCFRRTFSGANNLTINTYHYYRSDRELQSVMGRDKPFIYRYDGLVSSSSITMVRLIVM